MNTDFKRRDRVGEMLREKISLILLHKSRDPRLQNITITNVAISDDLRRAKIYYLTRGQEAELPQLQKALQKASGFIKQELAQEHILRVMPDLFSRLTNPGSEVNGWLTSCACCTRTRPHPMIPRAPNEAIPARYPGH